MDIRVVLGETLHTNCYLLVEANRAIAVDFVPEVADYIEKYNITLDCIVITHIHFDHIEGLEQFLKGHKNVIVYISKCGNDNINNPEYTLNYYRQGDGVDTTSFRIVKDNEILEWEGHKFIVIETPGHSIDSISIYSDELSSIFCGDVIFFRSVGRTDFQGGDFDTLMRSVNKLFNHKDDTALYPGHGPKTTIAGEKKYNSYIRSFI